MKILLREIRIEKHLTQQQLSDRSGVGRTTISNIENGIYIPGVDVAMMLAHALQCTVEDLFVWEGDKHK